ncbi:hypothetical protein [Winogradskyella psychrotolerans]|uniref:hypothetical protein n=1 Tax=Winogradskyella psychrotolerans TaxID=1344585 RepID=UPI001C064AE9|nr:hypothetical protein [Winogradskyella psychrotolerans]MBU2927111.1 hypothetical protein [Winogradskyella psychrotolerans]
MKNLIIFLCLYTTIASSQEESQFEIKDNLLKVGVFNNISLLNNLTLQNGLSVRKNLDFVTLEVPILIKHNISNKWSTFLGVQSRKVIYKNFPDLNIEQPSKFYISTGTEYGFKNNFTGNFTIGFPFDLQLGLKF